VSSRPAAPPASTWPAAPPATLGCALPRLRRKEWGNRKLTNQVTVSERAMTLGTDS
jgi:hypothetical protein